MWTAGTINAAGGYIESSPVNPARRTKIRLPASPVQPLALIHSSNEVRAVGIMNDTRLRRAAVLGTQRPGRRGSRGLAIGHRDEVLSPYLFQTVEKDGKISPQWLQEYSEDRSY